MTNSDKGEVTLASAVINRGQRAVLHNVALTVTAGSVHAIVGSNGSGKTSLLRALVGDSAVDSVTISGHELSTLSIKELATQRAVVRSSFLPQFAYAVSDVVAWSMPSTSGESETQQILERLGIMDLHSRSITTLSSGQLAKVNLASALAQNSAVIFADEPEAALDPLARVDMWTHLARSGKTVVVATHSLDLVLRFATHVTGIAHGSIAFTKSVRDTSMSELLELFN